MEYAEAIGIDFGTSNTCVGIYNKRTGVQILTDERKLANYVGLHESLHKIGHKSKEKIRSNCLNTIYDSKILLGKKFSTELVEENQNRLPFDLISTQLSKKTLIRTQKGTYQPEEITAMLLSNIKTLVKNHVRKEIKNAVITVPACFNDSKRQSIIDSAEIAGLNVIRLLNDSTAAAIAIAHKKEYEKNKKILVFDYGAYYLNLCVASIEYGNVKILDSKSYAELGGRKIDFNMADHAMKKLNIESNKQMLQALLLECEIAKENLSISNEAVVNVESRDEFKFTREVFHKINKIIFNECIKKVEYILLDHQTIDEVFLIGGCSKIPIIQEKLIELFKYRKLNLTMNAYETVAAGAAIQAAVLADFSLKTNHGAYYEDVNLFEYSLAVKLNQQQSFFLSSLNKFEFIQVSIIKDASLNAFNLVAYENDDVLIESLDLNGNDNALEIMLGVDRNGLVDIRLTSNNMRKKIFALDTKKYCLSKQEVENMRLKNEAYQKIKRDLDMKVKDKMNHLLNKCNEMKKKMLKSKHHYFFNFRKEIDDILFFIKETKQIDIDYDKLIQEISKIENQINEFEKNSQKTIVENRKEMTKRQLNF